MARLIAMSLCLICVGPLLAQVNPDAKVQEAIKQGKLYLLDQQKPDGSWELGINAAGRPSGWTSLALLALMASEDKPDAAEVAIGLKWLRGVQPKDTYVVALQTMALATAGQAQDKERIQENVDWLVKSRVRDDGKLLGWGYRAESRTADNSNTRFALLGMAAGRSAGAAVPEQVWKEAQDCLIHSQDVSGSWFYITQFKTPSLSMTAGGLGGLILSGREFMRGRMIMQKDGCLHSCGDYPDREALANAQAWLANNFSVTNPAPKTPHAAFYNLHAVERAQHQAGYRWIGECDWYLKGRDHLLKNQQNDGSWYFRDSVFDSWPVVSTSFALMFLSQGRTPVLISKLQHGPETLGWDWDNHRNEVRHLVDHAGPLLFKEPVTWQVFNARDSKIDKLETLTAELLQSPVAFLNGHQKPVFTATEKLMLKSYLDKGGFLLAEACCGKKDFDSGFRALMKELYPDQPLKPLSEKHPIWQAHAKIDPAEFKLEGVEVGGRTAVVYSPEPLSGWWEANQQRDGRGLTAFRLGTNIIAYATGGQPPLPRGVPVVERKLGK